MARRNKRHANEPVDEVDLHRRRARRQMSKGNARKAALALREIVRLTGEASAWVRLGDALTRARRHGDAAQALWQGLWIYKQRGEAGRVRSVARLILEVDPTNDKAARLAMSA